MRISKQISGNSTERDTAEKQGRGEYEWCQLTEYDPSREELLNRRVCVALPGGIVLDTGCILGDQGGKNRIRVDPTLGRRRDIYPHYHVGIAMLLPRSTRQEQEWGGGLPIMRNGQYSIIDIRFSSVELSEDGPVAYGDAEEIEVRNQYTSETINIAERFASVQYVWRRRAQLPGALAELIDEHETLVRSSGLVAPSGLALVQNIQDRTASLSRDMPGIASVASVADPLPALLQMAGMDVEPTPVPIDQIPTDQVEIRQREVKNQRYVAARDAGAVRFRALVRQAYNSTCLVCGKRLPACGPGGSPGVDSCHILPYSEYDLDSTTNGLCLCKLHHWAFDEGLIEVRPTDGGYEIAIPDEIMEAARAAGLNMQWLRGLASPVPRERLPRETSDWPNVVYLAKLREILYPSS